MCGEGFSKRWLREAGQCLLFSLVKYLTKRREKCEETNKIGDTLFKNSNIRLQERTVGGKVRKESKQHVEIDVWRWRSIKTVVGLSEKKKNKVKIMQLLQKCTLNKVKEMFPTFMQRGVYDDPALQNRSKCSPHYVCSAAAAVPEARCSVPDHSQHPDECSKLPIARHLHHPSLSDESVPAATNGGS